jgi:hydrogenase maturation protein HypF
MSHSSITQYLIKIGGQVQGVGFRPYIYRLAHQYQLVGWVKNLAGEVEIKVQGSATQEFFEQLVVQAPPLARPYILSCLSQPIEPLTDFQILPSDNAVQGDIHLPPDYFTCSDCLAELHNRQDRRYRYPFINCTQCGPRYTLISQLPYDRPNTSMAGFPLCPDCLAEYENPLDRRFHAQPLACPICGPQLFFHQADVYIYDTALALTAAVQALGAGKIVAVKGIGGYHLLCAADNDDAILRLRRKKPRPAKPLAVMLPGLSLNSMLATDDIFSTNGLSITQSELALLCDPKRPIVLVKKTDDFSLSQHLAPGLAEIGIMLPYSPLHHLLLEDFGAPVVATSANLSGEPVLIDNPAVETRLAPVVDAFLHHNRPILRPADDSVFKTIAKKTRPLRLGRGIAPLELTLPFSIAQPLLAVGAHLKNTIALAWDNRVIISPHIGDLEAPRSLDVFQQVIDDLKNIYDIEITKIICDAHPHYANTRWAKQSGLPVTPVFHHHAHASALVGEFFNRQPWLIFTWDGVGYGADGSLWGGEAFYGQPGNWQRVATMRSFSPPGGNKAGREPWRSALALCWELGVNWLTAPVDTSLLFQAWQRGLNCPSTTAVGRLFDAAAALTGVLTTASFEGQGPMLLEAIATEDTDFIELPLEKNALGLWQTDWAPLVPYLLEQNIALEQRAAGFHQSMAHGLLAQAQQIHRETGVKQIGLTGGVFQNRRLAETTVALLQEAGFAVYLTEQLPCNDGGLSFGQVIEYNGSEE